MQRAQRASIAKQEVRLEFCAYRDLKSITKVAPVIDHVIKNVRPSFRFD
jgi:hypothetical protein